jgi:hypothetical protein
MRIRLAKPISKQAPTPTRLKRVRKTGMPTCGFAMVAGRSHGKNALAAIRGDHCAVRIPAQ